MVEFRHDLTSSHAANFGPCMIIDVKLILEELSIACLGLFNPLQEGGQIGLPRVLLPLLSQMQMDFSYVLDY